MSNESTSVDVNDFRRACGLWGTGVSIVTTCDAEGRPFGLTMNAVSSLSLAPPMLLVCVDRGSDTLAPMTQSRVFCVNVLAREQEALSNRFAKKGQDKFSDVAFTPGSTGAPVLAGTLVSFECAVQHIYEGGDHQIFCGEVRAVHADRSQDGQPLLYFGGKYAAVAQGS